MLLFRYFDSELIDDKPIYNYKLLDGVSHERLGMLIVKNENIIEILGSISYEQRKTPEIRKKKT